MKPTDYNITTVTVDVEGVVGKNILSFAGSGKTDSFGLTIDNVKLVRNINSKSLLTNGNF